MFKKYGDIKQVKIGDFIEVEIGDERHVGHIIAIYCRKVSMYNTDVRISLCGYHGIDKNRFAKLDEISKIRPLVIRNNMVEFISSDEFSIETKADILTELFIGDKNDNKKNI